MHISKNWKAFVKNAGKNLSDFRTKFESSEAEVYSVATIHNNQKMLLFFTLCKELNEAQKAQTWIFFHYRKNVIWLQQNTHIAICCVLTITQYVAYM